MRSPDSKTLAIVEDDPIMGESLVQSLALEGHEVRWWKSGREALDALGATPSDIAIARCFVTDLTPERLDQGFTPILEMFAGAQPSVTGVGVAALAAPDLQIELELTVRLPD